MNRLFHSILAPELAQFLREKRELGRVYRIPRFMLQNFDRYISARYHHRATFDLKEAVHGWLRSMGPRKWTTVASYVSLARQFCLFMRLRDESIFIPDRSALLPARKTPFAPHILSPHEISHLVRLAGAHPDPFIACRTKTLIVLLYCTGMRPGEPARLRMEHLDFERGVIFVDETKGRSRWVPFHSDLADVLRDYLRMRNHILEAASDWIFVQRDGRRLGEGAVCWMIRKTMCRAGLRPTKGRIGPRPYDLRHTFAVHRLVRWYRSGADLTTCLPLLSAYMGHNSPLGTQTYLRATPWLMRLASRRFRQSIRRRA